MTATAFAPGLREMRATFAAQPPATAAWPAPSPAADLFDGHGTLDAVRLAEALGLSNAQLAETVGLGAATLTKADRRASPKAQARLAELVEILARVRDWAGSTALALIWYRSQPIPALDGRTAEALVKGGEAAAVRDWLDHLAVGGYA